MALEPLPLHRPQLTLHRRTDLTRQVPLDAKTEQVLEAFKCRLAAVVSDAAPNPQLILNDPTQFQAIFERLNTFGFGWLHSEVDRMAPRQTHDPDPFFLSSVVDRAAFYAWLPYIGERLPQGRVGHWSAEMLDLSAEIRTAQACLLGFEILVSDSNLVLCVGPVAENGLSNFSVQIPVELRPLRTGWQAVAFKSSFE